MTNTVLDRVKEIEKQVQNTNVCIVLDWLSIYFTHKAFFDSEMNEGDTFSINEDCYLLCVDRPTLHFNKFLSVIYQKEECANILYDSRSVKFFGKDVCKVEFKNHTLYSGQWQVIYDILVSQGLQYKAASRIDIAIDGVNYLSELLNVYAKQTRQTQAIRLKNSSEMRARFSAKVLNPKTMHFENFNIGSSGGNKMITVYNKTLEIAKSGKTYIQEYWKANKVVTSLQDLELQKKEIEKSEKKGHEVMYIEGITNIYRFELRLKSEAIKEIQNFSIDMLKTKQGLASIVKLHCKNYFEMQYCDNRNVSRATPFELLPYDKLEADSITKIERQERDGLYKAKLTIHGLVQDIYKGYVQRENMNESIEIIIDRCIKYNLTEHLLNKLDEWQNRYLPSTKKERIDDVLIVIGHLRARATDLPPDFILLASRHGQAMATARFGE